MEGDEWWRPHSDQCAEGGKDLMGPMLFFFVSADFKQSSTSADSLNFWQSLAKLGRGQLTLNKIAAVTDCGSFPRLPSWLCARESHIQVLLCFSNTNLKQISLPSPILTLLIDWSLYLCCLFSVSGRGAERNGWCELTGRLSFSSVRNWLGFTDQWVTLRRKTHLCRPCQRLKTQANLSEDAYIFIFAIMKGRNVFSLKKEWLICRCPVHLTQPLQD